MPDAHNGSVLTDKGSGATAAKGARTAGSATSTIAGRPHNDKQSRAGGTTVRLASTLGTTTATERLPLETNSAG